MACRIGISRSHTTRSNRNSVGEDSWLSSIRIDAPRLRAILHTYTSDRSKSESGEKGTWCRESNKAEANTPLYLFQSVRRHTTRMHSAFSVRFTRYILFFGFSVDFVPFSNPFSWYHSTVVINSYAACGAFNSVTNVIHNLILFSMSFHEKTIRKK